MSEAAASGGASGSAGGDRRVRGRPGWGALGLLLVVFTVLVGPMVWLEAGRTNIPPEEGAKYPGEVMDQDRYHWQVILEMEQRWPVANVVEYDSATTPGYHWVMAGVLRATGSRTAVLVVNALIGLGLVLAVWWGVAGAGGIVGGWRAAALAAPMMMSPYVLGGSVWMTTDNAALMFVALVLGLAVLRRFTVGRAGWMGVFATGAVLVRQVHVWPVAVIGLAGLLRSPLARLAPAALRDDERQLPRRWVYLLAAILAAAAPAIVLGLFVWLWGGLIPRSEWIRGFHAQGVNPAAPAFALTVVSAYGAFFLGLAWREVRRVRLWDWDVWAAGFAGLLVGAVFETGYERLSREFGWVWRIVQEVDGVMERVAPGLAALERSPVIIGGSVVGALVILLLYRAAAAAGNRTPALMLLLSLLGWVCAQTANSVAWQRYFDPIVLIGLAMLGALCVNRDQRGARWVWLGPIALAGLQLLLSAVTMYREFLTKML